MAIFVLASSVYDGAGVVGNPIEPVVSLLNGIVNAGFGWLVVSAVFFLLVYSCYFNFCSGDGTVALVAVSLLTIFLACFAL